MNDEIYPSKDESHQSDFEGYQVFYPSEESNPPPLMDCEQLQTSPIPKNNRNEKDSDKFQVKLEKIGRLLIGKFCEKLCLHH